MLEQLPSIFIAHSSLDFKMARVIRNIFEELEHEALLLKLKQPMTEEYLLELIRKEIKARDWMVIVQSANAHQSRWVPLEEAYARFYAKRVFYVNIEKCTDDAEEKLRECVLPCIMSISQNIRIFMSYAHADLEQASFVADFLRHRGYQVWDDRQISPGTSWIDEIELAIERTLERGCIILLVSANSVGSRWIDSEIVYAMRHDGAHIIPCLVGPVIAQIPTSLQHLQYVDLRRYDEGLPRLEEVLNQVRTSYCE